MKSKPWILATVFFINFSLTAQQPPPPGDGGDGTLVRDIPVVSLDINYGLIVLGVVLIYFFIKNKKIDRQLS